jgi:predicted permease
MLNDFRYSVRLLLKTPGFTAVAVLTLAIGIGANSAIFSLIHALILRKLPVRQPDRLVALSTITSIGQPAGLSYLMFEELQRHQEVFSRLFAWSGEVVLTLEAGKAIWLGKVTSVTGDYYSALGVTPLIGRAIMPEDEGTQGGPPNRVAVISYRCWQRYYGGDPAAIGKLIRIEGVPYTVVGVTAEFSGLQVGFSDDVTVPLMASDWFGSVRRGRSLIFDIVGRLKEEISVDEARAQLETLWPGVQATTVSPDWNFEQQKEFSSYRLEVASAATGAGPNEPRETSSQPLWVLMGITSLVLLIACVNLASLLLSRAAARQREMAVRLALGAGGWRLVRQLLSEGVLLSITGALPGLLFAWWSSQTLANLMWTGSVPLGLDLAPDLRVLGFTAVVAILTGIGFGLAPAWCVASEDPARLLQQSSRTVGQGLGRLGKLLVSTQVSLSLVLVIGSLLFARSLQNLRSADLGVRGDGVLLINLTEKPGSYHRDLNPSAYYRELTDRLSRLPGVRSVSLSQVMPIVPGNYREHVSAKRLDISAPGGIYARKLLAGPRFFETLGIPFLQGRDFKTSDDEHAPPVAIVSKELARQLFPSAEAVGQHISMGNHPENQDLQIIGVVGEVRQVTRENRTPMVVYLSYFRYLYPPMVQVRVSGGDPLGLVSAARHEIEALGRQYPSRTFTLREEIDQLLLSERMIAVLSGFFGVLALLLASIGLYGLMAYTVTRRTSEIGIRMALGAQRRNVLWLVLRETLVLVLFGVAIGLPLAFASTRLIASHLFGVTPNDPTTIAMATVLLVIVALLACYLPARRAARVDPMVALRCE